MKLVATINGLKIKQVSEGLFRFNVSYITPAFLDHYKPILDRCRWWITPCDANRVGITLSVDNPKTFCSLLRIMSFIDDVNVFEITEISGYPLVYHNGNFYLCVEEIGDNMLNIISLLSKYTEDTLITPHNGWLVVTFKPTQEFENQLKRLEFYRSIKEL